MTPSLSPTDGFTTDRFPASRRDATAIARHFSALKCRAISMPPEWGGKCRTHRPKASL